MWYKLLHDIATDVTCTITDIDAFTNACYNRADPMPAYDTLDMTYTMNDLLADENGVPAHFDLILAELLRTKDYSNLDGYDAIYDGEYDSAFEHENDLRLLNPFYFIEESDVPSYIRIRHGTVDDRVPIVTSLNLALAFQTYSNAEVDYEMVWGYPHGPAELNDTDLTNWIDTVCK